MYNKSEFPDQNLIGKILGSYYDPKIKPLYVDINFVNKEVRIRYKHDDFIELFGDQLNSEEIFKDPGEYIYEKKFDCDGLTIIASTYIIQSELTNKKLMILWSIQHADL